MLVLPCHLYQCTCRCHDLASMWSVCSDCAGYAEMLCVLESSDGKLAAWDVYGFVLIRSSTLWLAPFVVTKE